MTEPSFSVIIPAYNEADLVGSAIESVLRQSRPDWEAIVVDDGSTDGTDEAVREFERQDPRVRLLQKENEGLSAARNSGVEIARAPYISFLDSDDLLMPEYLDAMQSALEADPRAGFGYTDAWALDADSHRIGRTTAMHAWAPEEHPPSDPLDMIRLLIPDNFIFVSTTVRRSVFPEVGVFNPALRSAEDYDMWIRILSRGYTAVRPRGVLAIKRERPTAMSMNSTTMATNLKQVYGRLASDAELPADIRAASSARVSYFERQLDGLTGRSRIQAARIELRRLITRIASPLLRGYRWPRRPPTEVTAAFPDLDRL